MNLSSGQQRLGLATAAGFAGVTLVWLVGAPPVFIMAAIASTAIIGLLVQFRALQASKRNLRSMREALRKSEQSLGRFLDTLPAIVWRATPDGEPSYVNRRAASYSGRTLADIVNLGWQEKLTHPDDVDMVAQAWDRARETETPFDVTQRIRGVDGSYRWFHTRAEPLRDEAGRIIHWYGVDVDIDDRTKTEEALRKSEQELRLLIETLPAMVWRTTPDGEADYINRRLSGYTGQTLADLANLKWQKNLIHPDDVDAVARMWTRARETETPLDITNRVRRADGSYRWFQTRAEPMRDEAGHVIHWYGVDVDIDERRKAEEALRATQAKLSRASQVATVAELAASIAHELSQPLAALVANAHACLRWLSAEPPNLERAQLTAERIIRDGNSAAEVVSRIRALFKRTDSTRSLLDLNEMIVEVSRLLTDEASSRNVRIDTDMEDDLPPAWADRVQIQQVIANLARNGVDAMESEDNHPRVLSIRSRRNGADSVLIEIRDQGSGLEDAERVFEPFFTTKEKGMGMGLAISRSIVEAHEGRIWAARNDPRGATFSFTLPIHSSGSR